MNNFQQLADYIRKGIKLSPAQHRGGLFKWYGLECDYRCSCVLGAAKIGKFGRLPDGASDMVNIRIEDIAPNMFVLNPETNIQQHITTVCIYLNDHCRWTRERIADWLDTLS